MERLEPFIIGEYYHLFTRGVAKQQVFLEDRDFERFLLLLFLCNSAVPVHIANTLKKYQGEPLINVIQSGNRAEILVEMVAYALMPNHIHLIVREKSTGGISKFMLKLMTAYSMYFNTKYERSGPAFTRPFRSRHISDDDYFKYVFAYVLLNPLELFDPQWKESGTTSNKQLASYRYSSYPDYYGQPRPESMILTKEALPFEDVPSLDTLLSDLRQNYQGEPLII